jgi:hypothetical protein
VVQFFKTRFFTNLKKMSENNTKQQSKIPTVVLDIELINTGIYWEAHVDVRYEDGRTRKITINRVKLYVDLPNLIRRALKQVVKCLEVNVKAQNQNVVAHMKKEILWKLRDRTTTHN